MIDLKKLFCYGCGHASADTKFPGKPSGERPCCFCIRNKEREKWIKEAKINNSSWFKKENKSNPYKGTWYDGSPAIKVPMDCYHSVDMLLQIYEWNKNYIHRDKLLTAPEIAGIVGEELFKYTDHISVSQITEAIIKAQEKRINKHE